MVEQQRIENEVRGMDGREEAGVEEALRGVSARFERYTQTQDTPHNEPEKRNIAALHDLRAIFVPFSSFQSATHSICGSSLLVQLKLRLARHFRFDKLSSSPSSR